MLQNIFTYIEYNSHFEWQKLSDNIKTRKFTIIIPYVLIKNNLINQLAAFDSSSDNHMFDMYHIFTPHTDAQIQTFSNSWTTLTPTGRSKCKNYLSKWSSSFRFD